MVIWNLNPSEEQKNEGDFRFEGSPFDGCVKRLRIHGCLRGRIRCSPGTPG